MAALDLARLRRIESDCGGCVTSYSGVVVLGLDIGFSSSR